MTCLQILSVNLSVAPMLMSCSARRRFLRTYRRSHRLNQQPCSASRPVVHAAFPPSSKICPSWVQRWQRMLPPEHRLSSLKSVLRPFEHCSCWLHTILANIRTCGGCRSTDCWTFIERPESIKAVQVQHLVEGHMQYVHVAGHQKTEFDSSNRPGLSNHPTAAIELFFLAATDGRRELSAAALYALEKTAVIHWPQDVSKLPNASAEAVEKLASPCYPPHRDPHS